MYKNEISRHTLRQLLQRWMVGNRLWRIQVFLNDLIELGFPQVTESTRHTLDAYVYNFFQNAQFFCESLPKDSLFPVHFQKWIISDMYIQAQRMYKLSFANHKSQLIIKVYRSICAEFDQCCRKQEYISKIVLHHIIVNNIRVC